MRQRASPTQKHVARTTRSESRMWLSVSEQKLSKASICSLSLWCQIRLSGNPIMMILLFSPQRSRNFATGILFRPFDNMASGVTVTRVNNRKLKCERLIWFGAYNFIGSIKFYECRTKQTKVDNKRIGYCHSLSQTYLNLCMHESQ